MDEAKMKRWFYFSVGVLTSLILVAFGTRLISVTPDSFSSGQLLLFGVILIFFGIFTVTVVNLSKFWWINALVILLGFYACARSIDLIEYAWMSKVLGIAAWLGAFMILYITWPGNQSNITRKKRYDDSPTEV